MKKGVQPARAWLALLPVALGSAAACGTTSAFVRVPRAAVSTEAVAIEGSGFRLQTGRAVAAPFHSEDCPARPRTTNYAYGEQLGGRRVIVRHPSLAAPLYGILSLCPVHSAVSGPVARSYSIRIPEERVLDTDEGRVSVVYEPSGWSLPLARGQGSIEVPAWVLWLSREPFPR